MRAAETNARSDVAGFLTVSQAIRAGMQAPMAQAISIIAILPTPVLEGEVAIPEPSLEQPLHPAGALSGIATINNFRSELSPWLVKGICGPSAGIIDTLANAGSTASLNQSFNSLGAASRTARAAGTDLTSRECAATSGISRPKPRRATKQRNRVCPFHLLAQLIVRRLLVIWRFH